MFIIIGGDGKEYGPVSAEQIQQWLAGHRLTLDMHGRRVGETAWQRIRDFPEFAAAPAPVVPPPPPAPAAAGGEPAGALSTSVGIPPAEGAPPDGAVPLPPPTPPAPEPPPGPQPLVFTGNWQEYFKIWIVNVLLTIVTLGIYAAWAKVRKRRYFCANTRLLGHSFEYLADPMKILRGNLIVAGLALVLAFSQSISPFLYFFFFICFAITVPWFITRALAFNARNTAWRGLRFNFSGKYGEAARAFLLWPLLVGPTLGLIIPFIARRQKEFVINRLAFGTTPFSLGGNTEGFYKIYGIAALFFLPIIGIYFSMIGMVIAASVKGGGKPTLDPAVMGTIGLMFFFAIPAAIIGTFYFRSRMFNYLWNHTTIAGHRFTANLRARDLFLTHLLNSIVTALTLGLLQPWAAVRLVKLQLDSVQVIPAGNLDTFVADAQPVGSAVGDAASDFFDFDIGFGV